MQLLLQHQSAMIQVVRFNFHNFYKLIIYQSLTTQHTIIIIFLVESTQIKPFEDSARSHGHKFSHHRRFNHDG